MLGMGIGDILRKIVEHYPSSNFGGKYLIFIIIKQIKQIPILNMPKISGEIPSPNFPNF